MQKRNMTAGIIGATGYTGSELLRLLSGHPEIGRIFLASTSCRGQRMEDIYPNFFKLFDSRPASGVLEDPETVIAVSDIVFGALPSGAGEAYAAACLERGVSYIDLSADFRFGGDEETYRAWYGGEWLYPDLRRRSVYGLPELYRETTKALAAAGPAVIGNPGCYPTAVILAAYPALAGKGPHIAAGAAVIADAVSGVTGAGREPGRAWHFPECSDSVSPYKVGGHRHTPEISRNLSVIAGRPVPLVFTPHLGPYNRGILATVYLELAEGAVGTETSAGREASAVRPKSAEIVEREEVIRRQYAGFYRDERFVRVLPAGICAATNRVRQSNYCDISVHLDQGGRILIVVSAIDNMVKGAAGQAVQNMNIIAGFDETLGLQALPALF
ncbi:MAG: N-acetyl-gamma-glutamyl-phosphate reductase [Treponema sp.]|jgi:N-acetyl-gamma-glutamyl-phosphate reductase|nr:N-acetyl-gamma-glutamyl-phosphate reductase [Treponema sp.]